MKPRSAIGLCAIVVALYGLTACQPPQPRIAVAEGRASETVASTGFTAKDILADFDCLVEATRADPSGGLLILSSNHNRPHKLGNAETRRIGNRSAPVVFQQAGKTRSLMVLPGV